ncbi:hypothetical protein QIS74_01946 [Colletotrichum tabaci]|uniref:Uncharacterized protein n=1 Tax=Colletotrichum tabaci TaxID=1209068 RepID=A0AAV9TV27_9PEZI
MSTSRRCSISSVHDSCEYNRPINVIFAYVLAENQNDKIVIFTDFKPHSDSGGDIFIESAQHAADSGVLVARWLETDSATAEAEGDYVCSGTVVVETGLSEHTPSESIYGAAVSWYGQWLG